MIAMVLANSAGLPLAFATFLTVAASTSCVAPPNRGGVKSAEPGPVAAVEAIRSSVPSNPYVWKSVVVKGGGFVTGLAFSRVKPGILYARTDIGGAYRYEPEGRSWTPLTDFVSRADASFMGIESIAPDPVNADPFSPDHAAVIDGGGVWATEDLTRSEETAIRALISPPEGAPLLSVMADVCGFVTIRWRNHRSAATSRTQPARAAMRSTSQARSPASWRASARTRGTTARLHAVRSRRMAGSAGLNSGPSRWAAPVRAASPYPRMARSFPGAERSSGFALDRWRRDLGYGEPQ